MNQNNIRFGLVLILVTLGISGCSYPISGQYRRETTPDLTFPQVLEDPNEYVGSNVIWGGHIIKVVNYKDSTDLIILETPLDYTEEPIQERDSEGRFIVRCHKFLEPEVFKRGLKVTVAGKILGSDTRPLGESKYTYPVISVKQLYLWQAERGRRYRYPYYYGPPRFWGAPPPPWWY